MQILCFGFTLGNNKYLYLHRVLLGERKTELAKLLRVLHVGTIL